MKLYNINNIDHFCELINGCKGEVSLVTKDGSELNLKSKLSQFVALSQYFGSGKIPELEIRAEEPQDVILIARYLMSA